MNLLNSWFSKQYIKSNPFLFLSFLVPFLVRIIPEIIMGSYLVGFDSLAHYVPTILNWSTEGITFFGLWATAPFFYIILMGVFSVGIPLVLTLKVLGPLLLGFSGLLVFLYSNKTLLWAPKKCFFAGIFATLYFVALRVSWDMLRTQLALIFLFLSLILLDKYERSSFRKNIFFPLVMVFVVLSHQLVTVILFSILLVTMLRLIKIKKKISFVHLLLYSVPAIIVFFSIIYANYVVYPEFSVVSSWFGQSSDAFIELFGFSSNSDMIINTLSFLVFCYLPLCPIIIFGLRRFTSKLHFIPWIACIFIALSFAIGNVFIAVPPYRWTLLLTYPLSFIAVEGLFRLKLNWQKIGVCLSLGVLSMGFIFLPNNYALPFHQSFPLNFPTSMLQNTVSLRDCQSTVDVLNWANKNMVVNSSLLVHQSF